MADALERFVTAQEGIYAKALAELTGGAKQSHWMWFIFPQLRGLGHSQMAQFYGIAGINEAKAYLAHPVLGARLLECTEAMMRWAGRHSVEEILGPVDALKFASSMTLFEAVDGAPLFGAALDAFCGGTRDQATIDLVGAG